MAANVACRMAHFLRAVSRWVLTHPTAMGDSLFPKMCLAEPFSVDLLRIAYILVVGDAMLSEEKRYERHIAQYTAGHHTTF